MTVSILFLGDSISVCVSPCVFCLGLAASVYVLFKDFLCVPFCLVSALTLLFLIHSLLFHPHTYHPLFLYEFSSPHQLFSLLPGPTASAQTSVGAIIGREGVSEVHRP